MCVAGAVIAASTFSFCSLILIFFVYPKIAEAEKMRTADAAAEAARHEQEMKHDFLLWHLQYEYYRLQAKDEARFFDCRWKAEDVIPQPFMAYPYMQFFSSAGSPDTFTGMKIINDWPSLVWVKNISRYHHRKSRVLLGIRGSDYGVHKSNLPMEMLGLVNRSPDYRDDLIFMPDNYVFIEPDAKSIKKDAVQAACHNRTYKGARYVSNEWKFFEGTAFWDVYDAVFTNEINQTNDDVFIFAYSNGSTPRNQLMRFKNNVLKDKRTLRIKAIVDIETNYDTANIAPTAAFVRQNISGRPGRYYYAICASEDCPLGNHRELIKLLSLKPLEKQRGWVRWQDEEGRIVVDMIEMNGPIRLSHSSVIPFGIRQFEEMSRGSR